MRRSATPCAYDDSSVPADPTFPFAYDDQKTAVQAPASAKLPSSVGLQVQTAWRSLRRLELPSKDLAYDPTRYAGTELAARLVNRANHARSSIATGSAQTSSSLPSAPSRHPATSASSTQQAPSSRASSLPAQHTPVQIDDDHGAVPKSAAAAAAAPAAPPSKVDEDAYRSKLQTLIKEVEENTVLPEVGVQRLWGQLNPAEKIRFRQEFPQFMHYVTEAPPSMVPVEEVIAVSMLPPPAPPAPLVQPTPLAKPRPVLQPSALAQQTAFGRSALPTPPPAAVAVAAVLPPAPTAGVALAPVSMLPAAPPGPLVKSAPSGCAPGHTPRLIPPIVTPQSSAAKATTTPSALAWALPKSSAAAGAAAAAAPSALLPPPPPHRGRLQRAAARRSEDFTQTAKSKSWHGSNHHR